MCRAGAPTGRLGETGGSDLPGQRVSSKLSEAEPQPERLVAIQPRDVLIRPCDASPEHGSSRSERGDPEHEPETGARNPLVEDDLARSKSRKRVPSRPQPVLSPRHLVSSQEPLVHLTASSSDGTSTWTAASVRAPHGWAWTSAGGQSRPALEYVRNGSRMQGQSDHLANLQFGFEDEVSKTQATFLVTWASDRITARGRPGQPDLVQSPGVNLDFNLRQGIRLGGEDFTIGFSVRNLLDTDFEEFQKLGYPVFSQSTLPMDDDLLERLFGQEVRAGVIRSPLEIQDVWKKSYSASTNQKVWAAKFTARHPNLVALELSSFKCGHDAPIYTVIESIIESSGTPYFSFKDIDENKPSGSIKIRVKTYAHTLMLLKEKLEDQAMKKVELDRAVTVKKLELMKQLQAKLAGVGRIDANLDAEIAALDAQVDEWRAQEEASKPKAKRAAARIRVVP